jgi:hypothetical protein
MMSPPSLRPKVKKQGPKNPRFSVKGIAGQGGQRVFSGLVHRQLLQKP